VSCGKESFDIRTLNSKLFEADKFKISFLNMLLSNAAKKQKINPINCSHKLSLNQLNSLPKPVVTNDYSPRKDRTKEKSKSRKKSKDEDSEMNSKDFVNNDIEYNRVISSLRRQSLEGKDKEENPIEKEGANEETKVNRQNQHGDNNNMRLRSSLRNQSKK
jgi:hypothetical protein